MAASFTWPATLPQVVQTQFEESMGVNILRTPMEMGPAKIRKRARKSSILNVTFFMTKAQIDILNIFILDTIKGTYRFYFPHPRTNITVEARIVPNGDNYYSAKHEALDYYYISMQLEIIP